MKFNRYDALYAIFFTATLYLVFSNVRDRFAATVIMVLVLVIAATEHKHGFLDAKKKFDKETEESK